MPVLDSNRPMVYKAEMIRVLEKRLIRRHLIVVSLGAAILGFSAHAQQATVPSAPAATTAKSAGDLPARFHRTLSQAQKQHILDGQFTVLTSTDAMPPHLKEAFEMITGLRQFEMANLGQKYQATDVITEPGLPFRRLLFAGVSDDKWFIQYERGGYGHSYAVVVFSVEPRGTVRFFWGGTGFQGAKDLDDLRRTIAAGRFDRQCTHYLRRYTIAPS
jgi:hypothetical protein